MFERMRRKIGELRRKQDLRPFVTHRSVGARSHATGNPCCLHYLDQFVTIYAEAPDTGGVYGLLVGEIPQYSGPPPHTHSEEDEAFLVLEGHMHAWVGGEFLDAPKDTFFFLPRGQVHWFQAVGEGVTRVACIVSPGGHEDMFRRIGQPAQSLDMPPPLDAFPAKTVISEAAASGVAVNPTHADWVQYRIEADAVIKAGGTPLLFKDFWESRNARPRPD